MVLRLARPTRHGISDIVLALGLSPLKAFGLRLAAITLNARCRECGERHPFRCLDVDDGFEAAFSVGLCHFASEKLCTLSV